MSMSIRRVPFLDRVVGSPPGCPMPPLNHHEKRIRAKRSGTRAPIITAEDGVPCAVRRLGARGWNGAAKSSSTAAAASAD
jgi:hypothetical protein